MSEVSIRFGEADLTTCDREPIHIPGSIQPHGVLLVIDRQQQIVEQVAGDSQAMMHLDPGNIIGASLSSILEASTCAFVCEQLGSPSEVIAPLMRLGVRLRSADLAVDLTLQAAGRTAIIELEPARRTMAGAGDPIEQLKSLLAAIQRTTGLQECCSAAAIAMRAATGFDRAMVYKFLPDESGMVAAEDANANLESFLGLHYPATDIPKQARELYRRNWLRAIPNVDYAPAPLLPEVNPRTRAPIDMSHCDLRSVSPIHLEYLRNMGVCASLSASIICQNQLWGMLVLHHYSPRYVSADLRVACETFAQILSLHVETKVQTATAQLRMNTRRLREAVIARLPGTNDIAATLASAELLHYVEATGAVVYLEGQLHLVGETPTTSQILALVEWLNGINRPLFATECLSTAYSPAAEFALIASGMIAVGLSRVPRDYVLWFRPELGRTVRWAGDPSKPTKVDRHGARLTPRGSFAEWLEVTKMQATPWSDVDLEAAEALRVVLLESVLKSVDLARRERAVEQTRIVAEELEKRVAQRTRQLRALAADLEAVEDRERRQIARDLHDDLGQILAAARIRLTSLCQHEGSDVSATAIQVDALINRANNAIRSLAAQLAPDVLHELGLSPALEWLSEEIEGTFGIKVAVRDDGQSKPLAQEARSILYRAVRELLINVAKHAQTGSATVEIEREHSQLMVTVRDPGIGYDTAAAAPGRPLGLISLRERLSHIGGTVLIRSAPGRGTVVVLTAPLSDAQSER
ncbi:MAG: GAF domain-containing protein [Pseudomonadota bacterium]|nr:GAF domain-containing protein [Pseudomonadota bacterium]